MKPSYSYRSGDPVRLGDIVRFCQQEGAVVFIAEDNSFSPAYADWRGERKGFMIEFTNGARLLLDADKEEHLALLSRSQK